MATAHWVTAKVMKVKIMDAIVFFLIVSLWYMRRDSLSMILSVNYWKVS